MRPCVAILLVLAACSDDGDGVPLDGDVAGEYGGDAIDPRFAVAFTRTDGKLEMQFSETAISCTNHLHEGAGNPSGLFVRLILPSSATVGVNANVWVEYDDLHRGGTHQSGSNDGTVTLEAIDEAMVAGSVMHMRVTEDHGTVAFNGSFVVTRCP